MTIHSEPRHGAFAPPPGAPAAEPPAPPGPPHSATPPPGRRWLIAVVVAVVVAVVAVFSVVLLTGGGDDVADPLVGRYEGTDEAGVALTVSGEPPAISELAFEFQCGSITRSERVTLTTPLPVENGSFSLALPPPGAIEVSGSFGEGGQTASGSLSGGDCTADWTAAYVPGSASGRPLDAPFDNAVDWGDAEVRLTAGNFYIAADGLIFLAPNPDIDVFWWSDREGGSLRVEWDEHGREMDLEIDFESIGDEWWSDEIEFTDGTEDRSWLEFSTGYFRTPIGTIFRTDVFELVGEGDATLHFDDLTIEADLVTETEGGDDDGAAEVEAADDTAVEEPAVEPVVDLVGIGETFATDGLTVTVVDAYFDCVSSGGFLMCPADLSSTATPFTVEIALADGDPTAFEVLDVRLIVDSGREIEPGAGLISSDGVRQLTFAVPGETSTVDLMIGTSRVELDVTATQVESSDDAASDDTPEPVGADENFVEDFDGAFATGWRWNNEQPDKWSLSTTPGHLDIVAGDDPTANLLLRDPSAADQFAILAELDFEPTENFQFAGLVIIGADPADEVIRLGRAFCDDVVCVGDGLYFDRVEDGALIGPNYATPVSDPDNVLLILEVFGDTVMAFADIDGEFIELGSHPLTFTPTAVGLAATNSPVDIVASFDSFGQYGYAGEAG